MLNIYSYQPKPSKKHPANRRHKRPQKRRTLLAVAIILLAAIIGVGVAFLLFPNNISKLNHIIGGSMQDDAGPKSTDSPQESIKPKPKPSPMLTTNINIVAIIAANSKLKVGVGIQDISTGEHKAYGVTKPFIAASTGKLLTAATYYNLVEQGKRSLNQTIGGHTALYELQQMVNMSNNNTWANLNANLGLANITKYAKSININYNASDNTVTPASMASFLAELYNGRLLNKTNTNQLLSFMQNTNWETFIPPVVPKDITLYHKYGLLTYVAHDVAILVKGDKAYSLAIYTQGDDYSSMDARLNIIQSVAKAAIAQLFE